jgi:hypothetical protein
MRDLTKDLIISAKNKSDQVKTKKSHLLLAEGPNDKVVVAKELACRTKAAMQNSHRFIQNFFRKIFRRKKSRPHANPPPTSNLTFHPPQNPHVPGRHNSLESGHFTVSISEQRSIRALSGLTADVIRNDMGK